MQALLGSRREWGLDLVVATTSGLFLGLVGPFGSYLNGSRLVTVAYWVVAVWAGMILFGVTLRPAIRFASRRRLPRVVMLLAVTPLVAMPLALLCHVAAATLWPVQIDRIGLLAWYGQTLVISVPLAMSYGLARGVGGTRTAGSPPAAASPDPASGRLLAWLPAALGREILALQMEDHYVRVHTAKGSGLVLIPLRQAVHELAATGPAGLKVHRSWWVARHAVAGFGRDGRNVRLRLSNGLEVPVARTSVAAVRAAGWLDDRPSP